MSSSGSYSLSKINPKLLRRIYRACRPTLSEPNLALNLEICDFVNAKQGSAPRDAAIAVVKLIGQRDPQTSELAIALLDNLIKNCGYPFHLQISRKEFLNELVKRFPERPPIRYTRVQRLVLAQIEEWYQTICRTSKYKDDFGYIKDMHRLLSNKGYVFPEVKLEDAAVLNPSDNLKTLEDIQKEDALVHSAKLQELIRRGRPQDLQEANKLMKIMAGFKDDHINESKKQISDDIARLKRKVEILAEMLSNVENGGAQIENNEAINELYASVKSSQPIVTKIIEEGSDNEEQINDLLALNDNVNSVVNKFQLLKNGQLDEASKIKVSSGEIGNNQLLNLIDFDDDAPISNDQRDDQGYNDLLSELGNLAFTEGGAAPANASGQKVNPLDFYGSGGSIALGGPTPAPQNQPVQVQQPQPSNSFDLLGDFNSPSPQLQSNVATNNSGLDPFGLSFPSSTPSLILTPSSYKSTITVNQSGSLKIEIGVLPGSTNQNFQGKVLLSNVQASPIRQMQFLLAVPKLCKLNLKPQSGDQIPGFANHGITQEFSIENLNDKPLKVKWKAEFVVGDNHTEETGVSNLS